MHKILDHLNQRKFAVNTAEGAKEAVCHLLRDEPKRLKHTLGVVENMKKILSPLSFNDNTVSSCLQIAYLHDVGYSSDFAFSHFHPYDGYVYLKENGWSNEVCYAVLQHSFAHSLMNLTRLDLKPVYQIPPATFREAIFTELITLADVHTSSDGSLTDMSGRINDVANRHGQKSKVVLHLESHVEDVNNLINKWGDLSKVI